MRSLARIVPLFLASAASAQGVEALWRANCLSCHGDRGQGGPQAKSLLTPEFADRTRDRRFFDAIRSGVPGTTMAGFSASLSNSEAWGLVVHLRELQARELDASAAWNDRSDRDTLHHSFSIQSVASDGLDVPWAIAFLPDGRALVTNRSGAVMVLRDGELATIAGTPGVRNRGQGGMMEVAPHPDFAKNGWVYLSFSEPLSRDGRSVGMTSIVRGVIAPSGKGWAWTDHRVIFRAKDEHFLPTDIHFGCRLAFDEPAADGRRHLFFSIGERGRMEHAQDLARPNGKVHRVWDDGSIPDDNPFLEVADAYPSIWSYGHRNPQGLTFDLEGRLWDTEHGPRGGDELNLIHKGGNYGWPTVSFGMNYDGTPFRTPWPDALADGAPNHHGDPGDIRMPVDRWMPSIGACGLDVVSGEAFPKWKGDLLAGGLSGVNVDRIRVRDGEVVERERILAGLGRVRDVVCAPDGTIHVVLNNEPRSAEIVRLVPKR